MTIGYRAAQIESDQGVIPLTGIEPQDTNLPPDILNPATMAAPSNIEPTLPSGIFAAQTTGSAGGLLSETAPLSTSIPHSAKSTLIPTPTPVTVSVTSSATPTHTAAASSGISPGRLTAAIVAPIAALAILIPILTYWFLTHRRKLQEQKYASHRSSHSREPMIQKHLSYRGPPPSRPQRTPTQRHSPIQEPPSAQTRNSLGLFNFELSPTDPPPRPRSRESEASPRFRFSIARALEMRRSQPSIIQPHARASDTRGSRPDKTDTGRPRTRGSNRNSRTSPFEPPPPYASPRPSETASARSHFAPLSRIGTLNQGERSPPRTTGPTKGASESDQSTYASSDVIRDSGSYGHAHTRSNTQSPDLPSPPRTHGVVARKPVPAQSPRITSHAISPQNASHLEGPFSSYLPERISDVSGFSIDTSRWEDHSRQESIISRNDSNESSTIHPHNYL